jgi:membrane protein implicated in regulation of membrane protease activity
MPDWFFEWSAWIFGLISAIFVLAGWFGFRKRKPKTINEVSHGSRNQLKGGEGETVNKVTHGDDTKLSG